MYSVLLFLLLSHRLGRSRLFDYMEEKPSQCFSLKSGFVSSRPGHVREVMQEVKAGETTSYFPRPPLCLFCPLIPFQILKSHCRMNLFPLLLEAWLARFSSGMSSMVRLFDPLSQSQWRTDHPVPTGKTPEEVLKKYLQKVRHPPDEVSAGEAGQGSPSLSPTSISSSGVFAP